MVVLAPGGPPMSRRVYLSHLDMPKGDFRYWREADTRQTQHQREQVDEFRCSDGGLITSLRPAQGASSFRA